MSRRRIGSAAIVALLGLATPATSQVSLTVVDAAGLPVPAVSVHVLGTAEVIQELFTGSDGGVTIDTPRWPDVRRLSVSHLGFRTRILQADALPIDGVIPLERDAVGIEGLEVQARGELCPIDADPAAREVWAGVAARYASDTGRRRFAGTSKRGAGSVREQYLFRVDPGRLRVSEDRVTTPVYRAVDRRERFLEAFVEEEGYVWAPPRVTYGRRTLAWEYPRFEATHAYHFATEVFGNLHEFAVASERYGRTTLAFCPRSGMPDSGLRGLLEVVPGHRFVHAEWIFATEDPEEGAGGEVVFQALHESRERPPHLLAWRGLFFRHSGKTPPYPELGRDYYREVRDEIEWRVLPGILSRDDP
ncbi:MAG: carboxypeptidase-like regulatory domain-containing protein [Gemmatimonadota bacterium]